MIELLYQNHGVFPAGACHYMSIIWQSCSIFTKLCSNYIFCSLMRPPLKKLWLLCVGCVGSQFPVIKLATFLPFLLFLPTLAFTGICWFLTSNFQIIFCKDLIEIYSISISQKEIFFCSMSCLVENRKVVLQRRFELKCKFADQWMLSSSCLHCNGSMFM